MVIDMEFSLSALEDVMKICMCTTFDLSLKLEAFLCISGLHDRLV